MYYNRRMNKHNLGQKLTYGGFGDIYEGNISGKACIFKVIRDNTTAISRIKREVLVMKELQGHPSIGALYGVYRMVENRCLVYALEPLPYPSIAGLPKGVTIKEYRVYLLQVLEVLDYIHSKGIMHMDVLAQNILVDAEKQRAHLIDFGLSQFYVPGKRHHTYIYAVPVCIYTCISWA